MVARNLQHGPPLLILVLPAHQHASPLNLRKQVCNVRVRFQLAALRYGELAPCRCCCRIKGYGYGIGYGLSRFQFDFIWILYWP